MQNHSLVVEGMLMRSALGSDLVEGRFAQQVGAEIPPHLRFSQFWKERARSPQADGLAYQMIAALGARIAEGLRGAPGMRSDYRDQQGEALGRGVWRIYKGVQRKRQCQDAQGTFLPANPERTGHGWASPRPVFQRAPESLREAFVAGKRVSSSQGIDKQEPRGLENKFQVAVEGRGKAHVSPRLLRRDGLAGDGIPKPSWRKSAI